MNVLLIEDDIQLNTTISNFLTSIGFIVTSLDDGEVAIDSVDRIKFALYIIDINIPSINGLEIVRYIRQTDLVTPIIVITASIEVENFKTAFKNGCNEYIKKPFFLEELEIRINNLIKKEHTDIISISENISYDIEFEELVVNDKTVRLRKKERRLLSILLQNLNHTVSTDILHSYVWENEIRESYPLRQLISELRKYFETDKKFIFSDVGRGYRFEVKK